MSRLGESLERLERAVARLEAACAARRRTETEPTIEVGPATARVREAAGDIAARIDGALARVDRALGGEG